MGIMPDVLDDITTIDDVLRQQTRVLQDIRDALAAPGTQSGVGIVGDIWHSLPLLQGWDWLIIDADDKTVAAGQLESISFKEETPGWLIGAALNTTDEDTKIEIVADQHILADTTIKNQNLAGLNTRGNVFPQVTRYNTDTDTYIAQIVMQPPWPWRDSFYARITAPSDSSITLDYEILGIEITDKQQFVESAAALNRGEI